MSVLTNRMLPTAGATPPSRRQAAKRPLCRFAPALPGSRIAWVTARRRRGNWPPCPFGARRGLRRPRRAQKDMAATGRGRARGSSFAKRLLALSDRRRRRELDARVRPWQRGRGDWRRGLPGRGDADGDHRCERGRGGWRGKPMRSIGIVSPISCRHFPQGPRRRRAVKRPRGRCSASLRPFG